MWSQLIFLATLVSTAYGVCFGDAKDRKPMVCPPPLVYFEPLCTCLRPQRAGHNRTPRPRPPRIIPGSQAVGQITLRRPPQPMTNPGSQAVGQITLRRPPQPMTNPAAAASDSNPNIHLSGSKYVDSGDSISLKCNATRGPNMPQDIKFLFILNEIEWFRNGAKLNTGMSGLTITRFMEPKSDSLISKLTISKAGYSDAGTYICRISDKLIDSLKVTVLYGKSTGNEVLKTSSTLVFLVSSFLSSLLQVGYKLLPESMGGQQ